MIVQAAAAAQSIGVASCWSVAALRSLRRPGVGGTLIGVDSALSSSVGATAPPPSSPPSFLADQEARRRTRPAACTPHATTAFGPTWVGHGSFAASALPPMLRRHASSTSSASSATDRSGSAGPLVPLRVQGVGRKMFLRQASSKVAVEVGKQLVNRSLVRRLARRATIGIPLIGLVLGARLLRKDAAALALHRAAGEAPLVAAYGVAVASEGVDLIAQVAIVVGIAVTSGVLPASLLPASAAALATTLGGAAAAADKVSIACAGISCAAGVVADALLLRRAPTSAPPCVTGDDAPPAAGRGDGQHLEQEEQGASRQ